MVKYCIVCGKERKNRNKYTCSKACYAKYRMQTKRCVICNDEFHDPKSNMTVTCGPECSKINRAKMYKKGVSAEALKKAHEIAKTHPLTGRFETHMHAKEWVIQSPDGQIHKCRNLKLWLENHKDMLDGTVLQAWDGITKIKYSMQGKRKNKTSQWKGWRLLEWED